MFVHDVRQFQNTFELVKDFIGASCRSRGHVVEGLQVKKQWIFFCLQKKRTHLFFWAGPKRWRRFDFISLKLLKVLCQHTGFHESGMTLISLYLYPQIKMWVISYNAIHTGFRHQIPTFNHQTFTTINIQWTYFIDNNANY